VLRNRARALDQKRVTIELVNQLRDYDDVRIIGPLLTALGWIDVSQYESLFRWTLTRLLPRLTVSDSLLLSDRHRATLNRELAHADADYCCAILKALEEIGDGSSVPYVRRLAEPSKTTDSVRVKQAARECLEILLARTERKQSKERLLRPAEGDPVGTLLHPVSAQGKEDPDQLLRPGQSKETDSGGQR
jgi:hypothetical protein